MTLIIDLSPSEEARLNRAAQERGVRPEELARQLIAQLPGDGAPLRVTDDLRRLLKDTQLQAADVSDADIEAEVKAVRADRRCA